ncbi:MAG: TonB-dependent receptor plug domain-containing protein, partial [Deferribacteraceae bacterium]|nr:TonB-dependent receptor plug domain-containing protein [Deferribacteraceae bacterium]
MFLAFAYAEEETEEIGETGDEEILVLDDVEVKERLSGGNLGKTEIPRELLKNMPKGDGTVSDLLRVAPSVQYDLNYRSSGTAGEIAPAEVSISGGKTYENLFLVDGMSNSNMLDPGSDIPVSSFENIGGNPQKFFIDSWLIEDITLHDSNISAAYGDFTGGVVEVKTKNPGSKFGGKLSYKTTRSGWSHYYVDPRDREYFNKSEEPALQPNFKKDIYTASLSIPINADTGILASYNRTESIIPLGYFREYRDTERLSETYFLKAVYNINGSSYIDASAAYSPYTGRYFLQDHIDGDFELNGGGYSGIANYHLETEGRGEIKVHADYSFQENSRTKSKDYHMAWIASKFKPWGAGASEDYTSNTPSYEGGPGNIDKENGAFSLKFDHSLGEFSYLGEHKLSYGAAYNYIFGRHHRTEPSSYYIYSTASLDVNCAGDSFTCVDGDQYFALRRYYPASDVYAQVNEYAVYAEDEWKFSRLKLRAGARVSGDDYMGNINIAPRTQLQWDIFDDNATLLTVGYSRYYGANLLANKLREGMVPSVETV